jgi:hypothetical protein
LTRRTGSFRPSASRPSAASLAHEIGNPIAAILGFQELLLDGGLEEAEARDFLARMKRETERVHPIVGSSAGSTGPGHPGARGGRPRKPEARLRSLLAGPHNLLDYVGKVFGIRERKAQLDGSSVERNFAAADAVLSDRKKPAAAGELERPQPCPKLSQNVESVTAITPRTNRIVCGNARHARTNCLLKGLLCRGAG